MNHSKILKAILACALLGGAAQAQTGPAITTLKVGVDGGNTHDFAYYGQSGGIAAYSIATTSCNPGTQTVTWTSSNHPVIGQNILRLKDGRFEHLGQSWLKHGFCAVNEGGCGTCQSTSCSSLGIGCADTYWATLNDGQGGGPKFQVNAANGVHSHPFPSPTGPSTIRGRLQVLVSEIDPAQNTGATYFAEGQYVSAHTAGAGNGSIANSYRRLNVVSVATLQGGGGTIVGQPGVYAWKSIDPEVNVFDVYTAEGPSGSGRFTIASRVTDLGGTWRYDYVVMNVSSDRSAYSFAVPVGPSVTVSNLFFRDVEYHSGEPFSNTDWVSQNSGGMLQWHSTQTFAQNANANALRWGTMYTFGFVADAPPMNGTGRIELFKPGSGGDVLDFGLVGALGEPAVGTPFCSGDGSGTFCPCLNFGISGHGCSNSAFFQGSKLTGSGTASVTGDTFTLNVSLAVASQPGLFFQGDQPVAGGNGAHFGDGLRCAGGSVIRLQTVTATGGGNAQSTVQIGTIGMVDPGDTLYYQYWYRDPVGSPCGTGFNVTNGLEVLWTN